ncbi:MAG: PhnD/SsuA/transferrin family substrate-binding protein [Thermodesulfobacteriota bacterium]
MRLSVRCFVVLGLVLLAVGCDREARQAGPEYATAPGAPSSPTYHLAIHPLHNPIRLQHDYQPLVEYLNGQLRNARLELEASRDYANFEEKFRARHPEFLLPNPWQTLEAMKVGYTVIAMAGAPEDFKGIFVVRRDSRITAPADLRGKAVSYPSPTALAACIMPQYFLHEHGIKVNTEIDNRYVGSQESSIMNAYLKLTAAAATWPPPWRAFQKDHPREAAELRVIWETPPLINNSVMVRDDVPPRIREQVRLALLRLQDTPAGRTILAGMETDRFLPASDRDYEVVRRYVVRFEKEVRPVELRR